MARIRSLHPGQWTDEEFVSCGYPARLLCIGLRNEADDAGLFEWKPLGLKMRLMPADNVDVAALLAELVEAGLIRRYEVDGKPFGAIKNFGLWQSPQKPSRKHPAPDDILAYTQCGKSMLNEREGDDGSGSGTIGKGERITVPVLYRSNTSPRSAGQRERERDKEEDRKNQNPSGQGRVSDSARAPHEGSPDGDPPARPPQGWFPVGLIDQVAEATGISPREAERRCRGWVEMAGHTAVVERVIRTTLQRQGIRDMLAYLERAIRSEVREMQAPPPPMSPVGSDYLDYCLSLPADDEEAAHAVQH